jgi:hypothetical protein
MPIVAALLQLPGVSELVKDFVTGVAEIATESTSSEDFLYKALKRLEKSLEQTSHPPAPGYEAWFRDHGYGRYAAKQATRELVDHGKRLAEATAQRSKIVNAIRFLADTAHKKGSISKRIKFLHWVSREPGNLDSIFEDIFEQARFRSAIEAAIAGQEDAHRRLHQLAVVALPYMRVSRGPKISVASATHEIFLKEYVRFIRPRTYTWDAIDGGYTDAATAATRAQFDPDFNPQAACRRLRAHPTDENLKFLYWLSIFHPSIGIMLLSKKFPQLVPL